MQMPSASRCGRKPPNVLRLVRAEDDRPSQPTRPPRRQKAVCMILGSALAIAQQQAGSSTVTMLLFAAVTVGLIMIAGWLGGNGP